MMAYLISIYKRQKKEIVTENELNAILYHLKACGVHIDYAVHEQHGHYNKLHTHAIVRYRGKYKGLTSYGNKEVEGFDYKIHWKGIHGDYSKIMRYLEKTPGHKVAVSPV